MNSQKTISLQRNQLLCLTSRALGRDKLMNVDDDLPTCMRHRRHNDDEQKWKT